MFRVAHYRKVVRVPGLQGRAAGVTGPDTFVVFRGRAVDFGTPGELMHRNCERCGGWRKSPNADLRGVAPVTRMAMEFLTMGTGVPFPEITHVAMVTG